MNDIKAVRELKRLKQTNFAPLSAFDMSRLENGKYNPTPAQMLVLTQRLGTTVDKLYTREALNYHYPPLRASQRRKEHEKANGIVKISLRVSSELARRFADVQGNMTQAQAFGLLISEHEKAAALGKGQAAQEKGCQLYYKADRKECQI